MGSSTSQTNNKNNQVVTNTTIKEAKIKKLLARWAEQMNIKSLPSDLIELIINFMPNWLSWSQLKHGKAVTFTNHNRIVIGNNSKKASICCTNEVISSESVKGNYFSWEIIYYRQSGVSWPGFIGTEYDLKEEDFTKPVFEIGGSCLHIPAHCMSFYLTKESQLFICGDTQNGVVPVRHYIYMNVDQRYSHRLGFCANFKERTIKVFIDGISFGVMYRNIPKEFVICIGAAHGKSDVEIVVNEKNFGLIDYDE